MSWSTLRMQCQFWKRPLTLSFFLIDYGVSPKILNHTWPWTGFRTFHWWWSWENLTKVRRLVELTCEVRVSYAAVLVLFLVLIILFKTNKTKDLEQLGSRNMGVQANISGTNSFMLSTLIFKDGHGVPVIDACVHWFKKRILNGKCRVFYYIKYSTLLTVTINIHCSKRTKSAIIT